MDDKLTTKTAKFTSLENLYIYSIAVSIHILTSISEHNRHSILVSFSQS